MLLYVVLWLLFSLLVAKMASSYNRSAVLWLLLALIFSPLISGILLILLGKPTDYAAIDKAHSDKKERLLKLKKAQA